MRCGRPLAGGILAGVCPACAWAGINLEANEVEAADPGGPVPTVLFTVSGHEVLAEIARGGAGIVYRACQREPRREVALKMLLPQQSGSTEVRERFRLESATIAALDHPAILPVYATGEHDGLPWFTMKLATGGTLADSGQSLRGRWRAIADLLASLADGVHYAHSRGVLHRDLKPGNVLFDEAGRAHVSDFGLAKFASTRTDLTRAMSVMGTPAYMAPEVAAGGTAAATIAADVYSLGAMLYELLAGRPPFEGDSLSALFKQVAERTPDPPSRHAAGAPRELEIIALHCLEKDPGRRYASAAELADDLRLWLAGRSIRARPAGTVGRMLRWARRNPALACVAAALVLTLFVGSAMVFTANRKLRSALAESLVAQARAVRQSGRQGQRFEALALVARAARIESTPIARDEAIAALALPDWKPQERLQLWQGNTFSVTPSADFSAYLVEDSAQRFSLYRRGDSAARWTWTGPDQSASQPVFSRDSRWIAIRARNDVVEVLDCDTGASVLHLTGRPYAFKDQVWGFGQDMDFTPDGSLLAVTRPAGGVSFHRLPEGGDAGVWEAKQWVTEIKFSQDGARLAVGGGHERADSMLAVVDVATARTLAQETPARRVEFVEWSADGRWIACRVSGGNAEVRASADLSIRATLGDRASLHAHFTPDGDRLFLTEQIGETRLWEIESGAMLLAHQDGGRPANHFADAPIRQWRDYAAGPVVLSTFEPSAILRLFFSDEENYTVPQVGSPAELSPDRRLLAVGGWGGGMIVTLDGSEPNLPIRTGSQKSAGTLRFDPTDQAVWSCLHEAGLRRHPLVRLASGRLEAGAPEIIDQDVGFYFAATHRPSGRFALVNRDAGIVKIVDSRARREVFRWSHAGAWTAEFSPDGTILIVNGDTVQTGDPAAIHRIETGAVVRGLTAAPGRMARWSADGAWVLAAEGRDATRLWRTAGWEPGAILPTELQGPNRRAAFSRDGRLLAVRTSTGVQLLSTVSGAPVAHLTLPSDPGFAVDLCFDGNERLLGIFLNGRVCVWDLVALRRELKAVGLDWVEDDQ